MSRSRPQRHLIQIVHDNFFAGRYGVWDVPEGPQACPQHLSELVLRCYGHTLYRVPEFDQLGGKSAAAEPPRDAEKSFPHIGGTGQGKTVPLHCRIQKGAIQIEQLPVFSKKQQLYKLRGNGLERGESLGVHVPRKISTPFPSKIRRWEKAHQLTLDVYQVTVAFPKEEVYGLTSQIRRASSSIVANIAEGCGRGGNAEFRQFLQIAMGSASELEYHLLLARDLHYLNATDYERLTEHAIQVKKMPAALIAKNLSLNLLWQ